MRINEAASVTAGQGDVQQYPDRISGELPPTDENLVTVADKAARISDALADNSGPFDQKLGDHVVLVELNENEYDLTGLTGTIRILSYSLTYLIILRLLSLAAVKTWWGFFYAEQLIFL